MNALRRGGRAASLGLCGLALVLALQALWIPAKAQLAQVLLERAFALSLELRQPVKPWSWADTAAVARIAVPRLGISQVVLANGSGQALAFGPSELAAPQGSAATVIAAHRDTHFAFLNELTVGERISLQRIDGSTARYRVTGLETLHKDHFSIPQDPARPLLVLVTCYPFGAAAAQTPLRRIAWAELE